MPPPMQRFAGGPSNIASHYNQQYQGHTQGPTGGLPPPSLGSNPNFMNTNSMNNPFAVNGNALSLSGGFGGAGLGMPGGTGLASQAAQMSFAGASLQQGHNGMGEPAARAIQNKGRIREVWKSNLHEEMALLRQLVDKYPYIAMDIVFPGLVARPMGSFNGKSDYHYQCLRCNVDLLKVIQLGISLFTEDGESPPPTTQADSGIEIPAGRKYGNGMAPMPCTWQFNFKFSTKEDMFSEPSVDTLRHAGVDFAALERDGIDPFEFGSLMISSGLVCDEDKIWISSHSAYDFGYLTKILLRQPLPDDEIAFDKFVKKFFPSTYDIKTIMKDAIRQHANGQLSPLNPEMAEVLGKLEAKANTEALADALKIKRFGTASTAGSDALLAGKVFFKMRERFFNGEIGEEHLGCLWGLGGLPEYNNTAQQSTPQHYNQQLQENTTPNQNGHYSNGGPSTPNTGHAGLAHTPSHSNSGGHPMTPGGAFGAFHYGGSK